ncbi:hypothetical protein [Solimonas variicoloris]|nr:hypothetical protein [Solimonas variicoloris]
MAAALAMIASPAAAKAARTMVRRDRAARAGAASGWRRQGAAPVADR